MYKNLFINIPKNNSIIHDNFPEISFISLNRNCFNNFIKIKMYLNGKKVHPTILKNKITYIPNKKLHKGLKKVKLIIYTDKKEKKEFAWCFQINSISDTNKFNFYFGIPHAHTSFSTGRGTPLEAFNYAKKKGLDFLIITDHCGHLFKNKKYKSIKNSKWETTKHNAINFNNKNKTFLSLNGFETSSRGFGDFNVLNIDNLYKGKIKDFNKFCIWLEKQNNPIVSINHPHKYIESFKYSKSLDKFINFIEVGNGSPPFKYLNGEKYYYKLLDEGWHLGALNGQDNHRINWGDTDNVTVVICSSLDKNHFYDALSKRRTYSSETKTLKMIFKINNMWMGSILNPSKKLDFEIYAEDKKEPLKKIQIISNKGKVIKEKNVHTKNKFKWNFSIPYEKNSWYVAKIVHKNNACGISSSIFT